MCGGGKEREREREMPKGKGRGGEEEKNKRKRNGEKFPNKYLARDNDTDCLGMSEFRYKRYFPGDDCTEIYLSASTLRLNTLLESLVISVRKASLFFFFFLFITSSYPLADLTLRCKWKWQTERVYLATMQELFWYYTGGRNFSDFIFIISDSCKKGMEALNMVSLRTLILHFVSGQIKGHDLIR